MNKVYIILLALVSLNSEAVFAVGSRIDQKIKHDSRSFSVSLDQRETWENRTAMHVQFPWKSVLVVKSTYYRGHESKGRYWYNHSPDSKPPGSYKGHKDFANVINEQFHFDEYNLEPYHRLKPKILEKLARIRSFRGDVKFSFLVETISKNVICIVESSLFSRYGRISVARSFEGALSLAVLKYERDYHFLDLQRRGEMGQLKSLIPQTVSTLSLLQNLEHPFPRTPNTQQSLVNDFAQAFIPSLSEFSLTERKIKRMTMESIQFSVEEPYPNSPSPLSVPLSIRLSNEGSQNFGEGDLSFLFGSEETAE